MAITMNKKKIEIKPTSDLRDINKEIDAWVTGRTISKPKKDELIASDTVPEPKKVEEIVGMYRLSLDIPTFLHRRIKKACAVDGITMKVKLTDILLEAFPEK
jgi:hypothetical protein